MGALRAPTPPSIGDDLYFITFSRERGMGFSMGEGCGLSPWERGMGFSMGEGYGILHLLSSLRSQFHHRLMNIGKLFDAIGQIRRIR